MPTILQIFILIICMLFLVYVVSLVKRKRLLLKYSLLWLALSIITGIFAIFPQPLYLLAPILGFETPSNFILVIAIFFLLAMCLSLSIIVSKQSEYIKSLVQDQALTKKVIGASTEKDKREK